MKKWFGRLAALALLIIASNASAAIPELKGRVNDYANVIPAEQEATLEARLARFDELPGKPQVVVLTTPSLDGEDIDKYSIDVARAWGIGQKGLDNGVLITVYPAPGDEFKHRIEVGYGLEGMLTDLMTTVVFDKYMHPHFVNEGHEDYFAAFMGAADAIDLVLRGQVDSDPLFAKAVKMEAEKRVREQKALVALLITAVFSFVGAVLIMVNGWVGAAVGVVGGLIAALVVGYAFTGYIVFMILGLVLVGIFWGMSQAQSSGSSSAWSSSGSGGGGFSGGGGNFGGGGSSGGR
ncbi:MAG: TPM domain-containing protein [Candidatus Pacebacteria bacterium]|nr:TPM domain-containing protein [Candidatus Paceibacterota bacterium]